jgi:uncharacterized protein
MDSRSSSLSTETDAIAGTTVFVVFHFPGPRWLPNQCPLLRPGVKEHFAFLSRAFASGQIALAGPFLSETTGGMVILDAKCTESEARALAFQDPGVVSGLIRAEVRPWMVALHSNSLLAGQEG